MGSKGVGEGGVLTIVGKGNFAAFTIRPHWAACRLRLLCLWIFVFFVAVVVAGGAVVLGMGRCTMAALFLYMLGRNLGAVACAAAAYLLAAEPPLRRRHAAASLS